MPRKMAMYIARKYGDYRFQELADAFGLQHYGGASYAVYAFAQELKKDPGLEMSVNNVVKKLGFCYPPIHHNNTSFSSQKIMYFGEFGGLLQAQRLSFNPLKPGQGHGHH